MKKAYSKPEIMFEDFTLNTYIAASCGYEATHDAALGKWKCSGYQLRSGEVVFMAAFNGCITVEADGDYNGYCYHVPTVSLNLFGS